MQIERGAFGTLPDGRSIDVITLRNRRGVAVRVITWGAIITSIATPDRHGDLADVVLGFDTK